MVFILIVLGQHQNFLLYPDHSEVMSSHARIYYMNKESFVLLGKQGKYIGFSQAMRTEPYRCMKITVKLLNEFNVK